MQFNSSVKSFMSVLNTATPILERRQPLDALSLALFSVEADGCRLAVSNGEMELSQTVPDVQVTDGQALLLPVHELSLACRNKPFDAEISAICSENNLKLTIGDDLYQLKTLPAEQFPRIETVVAEQQFEIRQDHLKHLFEKTSFSIAQRDPRHYLTGLLLEVSAGQIAAVATDGHRMALCRLGLPQGDALAPQKYILSRRTVLFLQKLLNDDDSSVKISASSRYVSFEASGCLLTTKLIDGEFPEYERVIPADDSFTETFLAEADSIRELLLATSVFEQVNELKLTLDAGGITAVKETPEGEKAEARRAIEYAGQPLSVTFNANYLQEMLNVVETERISFNIKDANSGVLFLEHGSEAPKYVIMPIRS